MNYTLYLYRYIVQTPPPIILNQEEHSEFIWQPIPLVSNLALIEGQFEAFSFVYLENTRAQISL